MTEVPSDMEGEPADLPHGEDTEDVDGDGSTTEPEETEDEEPDTSHLLETASSLLPSISLFSSANDGIMLAATSDDYKSETASMHALDVSVDLSGTVVGRRDAPFYYQKISGSIALCLSPGLHSKSGDTVYYQPSYTISSYMRKALNYAKTYNSSTAYVYAQAYVWAKASGGNVNDYTKVVYQILSACVAQDYDTYWYLNEITDPSGYAQAAWDEIEDMTAINGYVYSTGMSDYQYLITTLAPTAAPKGYLKLVKSSSNTSLTSGNSGYSLKGAVYYVYSDSGCTNKVATLTTDSNGTSNTVTLTPGPYYIKEITAPTGYILSTTVTSATVTASATKTVNVSDVPKTAKIKLGKVSGNTTITGGVDAYSLTGAKYTLYEGNYSNGTSTSAALGWQNATALKTYTTGSDGTFTTSSISINNANCAYYLKETTPSAGYEPDTTIWYIHVTSNSDGGVNYSITYSTNGGTTFKSIATYGSSGVIDSGGTISITSTEPPLNDPFALILQKMDYDTSLPTAQGSAALEGALFQVDYYDNTAGKTTGTPFRTWVFATDENGKLYCYDEFYLVAYISDTLYKDPDMGVIYPLGTYTIKEIQPPKYYKLEGSMRFIGSTNLTDATSVTDGLKLVIQKGEDGYAHVYEGDSIGSSAISATNLAINIYDEVYKGSVKVFKYDTDGKAPLPGVSFKLVGDDGSE